jgi:GcrA cell cycle regulator
MMVPSTKRMRPLYISGATSPYSTCQWPYGDPRQGEFHFCGDRTYAQYSYCQAHAEAAYRDAELERKMAKAA